MGDDSGGGGGGGGLKARIDGVKPAMGMVLAQLVIGGANILYKLAMNDGMKPKILVALRYFFAAAFLVPIAYFVDRKRRPKMTAKILMQAFCCGLFGGSLSQNMYVESVKMTSATFATAMLNLVPAITFILAVILRMEKVGITTAAGQAKVAGTLAGLGGAMILTFYKGPELHLWSSNISLLKPSHPTAPQAHENTILGSFLAIASCFSLATWTIIQAKMTIVYPAPLTLTALMCSMAAIQAGIFGLCLERDFAEWKMGFDIRLLTVAYSGVITSALIFTVMAWCIQKKGPIYTTIFNPLMLVFVAILGSLLLHEMLHAGSIIGTVLIIIGLYLVLWGKGREVGKVRDTPSEAVKKPSEPEMEPIETMVVDGIPVSRQGSLTSSVAGNRVASELEDVVVSN